MNLAPFDQLCGGVSPETYERYLLLLKKGNINMVRVNGVGLIEKEIFYHLCDVHGIMVWQDFIQSSSGIDNIPPEDPRVLELLERSARQAVRDKRNHVSHTMWCGGNELIDENDIPITYHNGNIKRLKKIVEAFDPDKLFLPTTASGPNKILEVGPDQRGRNHDVHGGWKYEGITEHYRKYNLCDCLFHGEWWDTLQRDTGIFESALKANSAAKVGRIEATAGKPPEGIFFLRLEAAEEKQITDRRMESAVPNLYVFPRNGDPIFSPLMKLKKGKPIGAQLIYMRGALPRMQNGEKAATQEGE